MLSTIFGDAKEFRFCVPDEWYRRPNSRVPSVAPSESTLRRLSDLEAEEEEGDREEEEVRGDVLTLSLRGLDTEEGK